MQKEIYLLVIGFIVILFGLIFIQSIGDSINPITTIYTETNESISATNATPASFTYDIAAFTELRYANHSVVDSGDYSVDLSADTITINSGTATYYADYTYYPENYVQSGTSRTLVTLIMVFFAIAILFIGYYYLKPLFEQGFGRFK